MKILAIADEECKALWDYFTPDKLEGVELIIACGDLSRHYLEYLATMAPMPVLYVHGNHDESYDLLPPQGVICIDDEVYVHNGLRVAGLGGSCRYHTGAWQFTEAEMKKRVNRLRGKIDRHGGVDIFSHPRAAARLRRHDRPAAPRVHGVFHAAGPLSPAVYAAWAHPFELRCLHPAGAHLRHHPHRQLL